MSIHRHQGVTERQETGTKALYGGTGTKEVKSMRVRCSTMRHLHLVRVTP